MKFVKIYLEGSVDFEKLAEKYNISHHEIIRRWVNSYQIQGYEGLKVDRKKYQS
ncbi:hypothetical protein [uncultured Anaerococcus sp.]|uniref:hypothetical protein n=1 Tax=uncultured Anaerococcus sp. TaxID=293428 RepID=UPI0026121C35|nr:hypothetical protein [uncultured Anaerococcus sp.]